MYDIERLRADLCNYFESAYFVGGFGGALIDLGDVLKASEEELLAIAMRYGFDIDSYLVNNKRR